MKQERVAIERFLELARRYPVLDVRSPGEYLHAHLPGAHSFPLFSDEERKVIGTTYKQVSRESAIKSGLDFFGPRMRSMVEAAEAIVASHSHPEPVVLVHCWRGGMRSEAVSWLLSLYGFQVYTLEGGYKAYRRWIIGHFSKSYPFRIIGGYTGSGKTEVLRELKKTGRAVLDLEAIAGHRGSAFGEVKGVTQPGQEMFENRLGMALQELSLLPEGTFIWTEDESQRIGDVNIPIALWNQFRTCPLYFLDISFEQRLDKIVRDYGKMNQEKLVNGILRIRKRLGPLESKTALHHLLEGDLRSCFSILLKYYDKQYRKALSNRPDPSPVMHTLPCAGTDARPNTLSILNTSQHDS